MLVACDTGGSSEPPRGSAGNGDPPAAAVSHQNRPNIVVVMTDDQDLASVAHLPEIRRFAKRGTTFSSAVTTTPECCPSRATFLTGQYAHNHGVLGNIAPDGGYAALDGTRTLPVWLSEAGYRTAHVGRYLNSYGNSNRGTDPLEIPPGWDEWRVPVEHTEFRNYNYTLNENGRLRTYGASARDYQTDVFARKAAAFVRESADGREPFFLSVASLAPHKEGTLDHLPDAQRDPRPAPRHYRAFEDLGVLRSPSFDEANVGDKPRFVSRLPRFSEEQLARLEILNRSRLESLLAVDDLVDRLVRELRRADVLENTVVVFTSDQGFLLGEHRLIGKGTLYEGAIRVPLIARGPGFEAGAERDHLVANVDLAPTLLDVAGAAADRELDGSSLIPIARDGSMPDERAYLIELQDSGTSARDRARDPDSFYEPEALFAVRTPEHSYIRHPNGDREPYDLVADPDQLENLDGDPGRASAVAELDRLLEELRGCTGAACR